MEEVVNIFKDYAPIKSIYDTGEELVCFPIRKDAEPVAVFYDKKLKQFEVMFFYEDRDNTIPDAIESGKLVYGEELKFND